ncbi:MAG: hypothetical protein AAF846_25350 [Chloroflexota bacterium]
MRLRDTYITRHKDKLPHTYQIASEHDETEVDFAIRKLWWARDYFVHQGEKPTRAQLLRKAGVRRGKSDIKIEDMIKMILNDFS